MTRVWDNFITEQDKAHLATRGPRANKKIWGARPAVLNIDNYRCVAGDEREDILDQIKVWPSAMGDAAWDALDNISDLLASARDAGMPIAHVRGMKEEETGVELFVGPGPDMSRMSPEELDRHQRRFDFMPQAAPVKGEIVLDKMAPSAFFGTPLMAALNRHGVDTLIITGESTSGCVRASVIDVKSYRFNVVIAEECVYDRHEASHAINLFDMNQKYATVLPLAEIKEWIAEWAAKKSDAPMIAAV